MLLFLIVLTFATVSDARRNRHRNSSSDENVTPNSKMDHAQDAYDSSARREAMFPGWGECRYDADTAGTGDALDHNHRHRRHYRSLPASANFQSSVHGVVHGQGERHRQRRNLIVINALGDSLVRLYNAERNIAWHFPTGDVGSWDCLAMVYGNLSNSDLSCLMQHCEIERGHNQWGEFLLQLPPILTNHYAHVVVLLDDIFLPHSYNVTKDIQSMRTNSIDVLQPAVSGAHSLTSKRQPKNCLYSAPASSHQSFLEFFFTFFTAKAWASFYHSVLEIKVDGIVNDGNPGGCGYDVCFPILCPHLRFGTESRSVVFHLETLLQPDGILYNRSGFGDLMKPHMKEFTHKTKNKCNWRIHVGNCTVTKKTIRKYKHVQIAPIDCIART